MDYFDGVSLKQFIQDRRLDHDEAKIIIKELFYGICSIHSFGICHRDIHPENILIKSNNEKSFEVKIIDFNAAFETSSKPEDYKMKEVIGFIPYRAPEVNANNSEGYDSSIDFWGLGAIAYKIASGKAPFGEIASDETL